MTRIPGIRSYKQHQPEGGYDAIVIGSGMGGEWADMGEVYDRIVFGDEVFEFHGGRENFVVTPSFAHLGLYLGFKESAADLGLQKANYWIYPDGCYDHDANLHAYLRDPDADFPVVYISFPSAKDPDWDNRYPGRATIDVITIAPYRWFARWGESRWMRRGEGYEKFKDRLSQRLLEVLYRYEPQLRGKLDHCELSTPLSTRHFANYSRGEIYGLAHDPARFAQRFLKPKTPVRGLYLTGQDVATAGIAAAAVGR